MAVQQCLGSGSSGATLRKTRLGRDPFYALFKLDLKKSAPAPRIADAAFRGRGRADSPGEAPTSVYHWFGSRFWAETGTVSLREIRLQRDYTPIVLQCSRRQQ